MPYRFLDHLATSDVAFEATGKDLDELFESAAKATINTMLGDLSTLVARTTRGIELSHTELDLLLFEYLQELIYYKDADGLLLLPKDIKILNDKGRFLLNSIVGGEEIDPSRHEQLIDVKAVTLHCFELKKVRKGWQALVILDV
jgi:SHS2 domain-containing protein